MADAESWDGYNYMEMADLIIFANAPENNKIQYI